MNMSVTLIRPLRRFVIKKCGGFRRLAIVLSSLVLVAYTLRALFIGDGRNIWDVSLLSLTGNITSPCEMTCPPEQLSFYIRTGEKSQVTGFAPQICFQGIMYMSAEQGNVGRGLNVLLIDSKSFDVKAIKVFDTYIDEAQLLRFLKKDTKEQDIVLMATYDDASYGLKESGRQWLGFFGSSLIDRLGFRENFIMIGHKGLVKGNAIEYHVAKKDKADSFAPPIEKAGCFSFPLGQIQSLENTMPDVLLGKDMKLGQILDNCGLPEPCPDGHVSVAVDTGQGNIRQPSICVDGYIRMDTKTNDAGRGFNIIVLDPLNLQAVKLSHMDTYTYDSTDLELMLESLQRREIIIAVISDDGSKKLGQGARDLLNKLGSGHIQNLRFRDVWYFVGQKGIDGFTQLEQLSFAGFDGGWPKPLVSRFCLSKVVPTSQIMIEPESRRNDPRRQFCMKYEGYIDFCSPDNVDEELKAIPVSSKALQGHEIFNIPIIIVPGLNHNAYVHTLQTVIMQPGIKVENVAVFWDEKLPEYGELTTLFGFQNYSLGSSVSYTEQLNKALQMSRGVYPSSMYQIVIEEDLLLAPDFMPFMAQCLGVINNDEFLAGAIAWNINGFYNVSGNSSLMYRVQEFPGLGFLMKSSILEKLSENLGGCCGKRAWDGWHLAEQELEMLMPDVSRVYRAPFYGAAASSDLARSLFMRPRKTYLNLEPTKLDLEMLISSQYEEFLRGQILISEIIPPSYFLDCVQGKESPPDLSKMKRGPLVVYYYQNNITDFEILVKLCQCFGLVTMENNQPKNLHNGLLRFFYEDHDVYLIGTKTSYFNQMSKFREILNAPDTKS